MFNSSKNRSICTAWAAIVVAAALPALSPSPAAAQGYCAQHVDTLLDTTESCVNEPWRDRAKDVQTFRWKGHDYMIFNRGNELSIYQVDNPANPLSTDTSNFDYDLISFDVCDDCRYGVLGHKLERTVVFDLGSGAVPSFGGWATYDANESTAGGYLFLKGGQQYLIATDLPDGCNNSGLYTVSGVNQLDLLECLEIGGAAVTIGGLHTITDASGVLYLYAAERSGPVRVFRADGSGAGLTMVLVATPAGMFGRAYELSIDKNTKRAASADYAGGAVGIWDLSNPDDPDWLYDIPVQAGTVSLRSPSANAPSTLFTAIVGWPDSTNTFTVEPTGYDEVVDPNFWYDDALPHNPDVGCAYESGGALSRDGSVLFLSRYAVHQVFDLSECLTPTPPEADMAITPIELFPGDTVTVRDISTGNADRWALWITKGPDPDDPFVTGYKTLSASNPRTIAFTIPVDLAYNVDYWAHVEVESDDFSPPDDFDSLSMPINVDRSPLATISVDPETVIVTEHVDLSATVNGGSPTSYQWQVWPPGAATPDTYSGQQVSNLLLDASGDWRFDVFVDFQHDEPGGPNPYQATDSYDLAVSSVAADFFWTPANPLHTQPITLDGSISKPAGGLTYQWQVVEHGGPGGYSDCPAAVQCVIPADYLDPDTVYDVTLTASNGPESSVKTRSMTVGNGNVAPVISWSPTSPEIGDNVGFLILGVPADIDSASWNLGGPGCDNADSTPSCTPSLWNDCKTQSYAYSSSGTKTVSLSVVVGDNTFTAPPVQVSVQASGSCNGPPPPNCTYSLSQSSVELGPGGGEAVVTVNTQSGCSWTASTTTPWITILSPIGALSGTGNLRIRVDENTGPYRTGSVVAGGKGLAVNQRPPVVPVTFTYSNRFPEKGEVVTFSVDPILQVTGWDFGEADCRGNDPEINCFFQPSGACNTYQWAFPTSGEKEVTMFVEGDSKTRPLTVKNRGECCLADGRPDVDFAMSAVEAYTGDTIFFTDLSAKAAFTAAKAISFGWNPQNPEIGQPVSFTLDGVVGDIDKATWDFGGSGCDGASATQVCTPSLWNNCLAMSFSYASAGTKSVSVTVDLEGGGTQSIGPQTLTVANTGECETGGGGGGPICSYVVSPSVAPSTYPPDGGNGSFNVTTTQDCEWSPITYSSWVHVVSGGGFGSGTVQYTVDANPGSSTRTTTIWVEGSSFRLTQAGDQGDTAPSEWRWTVTRVINEDGEEVDEDYFSSSDQNTSYRFSDPGRYRVSLTAINCFGTSTTHRYVEIVEAPVESFVIGAAISQGGANNTQWETDLRFFNPCGELLDVRIEYLPENTDNAGAELFSREFQLQPNETRTFDHITEAIPGLVNPVSGSVRVGSTSDSGCKVLSVSRTFNDTPAGSLGLFVPALPVKRVGREFLDVTGLIHNQNYRTNLRLVNYSDEEVWVPLTAYDKGGAQIGERRSVLVKSQSTRQINGIAEWLGATDDLAPFTVRAEINGLDVQALGTVVDNMTGDSVLFLSSFLNENQIWLAGVASLSGVNNSQWRTDLWLYNPTEDWLPGEIEFVVGDDPSESYPFEWPTLNTRRTKQYLDIVTNELQLQGTRGYIVLTGADGGPAPQVSARTFNLDTNGGTYGLNLRAFGSQDLLEPGEVGYVAGISNSDDRSVGYRTNVGVLNTNRDGWTTVRITMYNLDGSQAAEPFETNIAPGKLRQFDIFKTLDLGNTTMTGSLKIEAVSGGAVAVYATEIDNRTQDSIFIPAQRLFMGLAR